MRMITLTLRGLLAVALAVALALPTGLASGQDLAATAQSADTSSSDGEAATTSATSANSTATTSATNTSNEDTSATDSWSEGNETAFTDVSNKTITSVSKNLYLMVDNQFVSGAVDGQVVDGTWTEGVGPKSDGSVPDGAFLSDYNGNSKIAPSRSSAVDDTFLENLKTNYMGTVRVGGTDTGNRWATAKENLKGDSFEGLYVYYKSQLRTRLAWAGTIDGATWVVPWDDDKADDAQCNPANKSNDANKCFMTKLADGAILTFSFFASGSRTISYESAVSAGNAIGLSTDTDGAAENSTGTILNREHADNRATVLRKNERVRPGRSFSFNVQMSHGGTYLRIFLVDSNSAETSACPVASDVTNTSDTTGAFKGTYSTNLIYSDKIPTHSNATATNVTVKDNASDSKIKTVTISGAATNKSESHISVCVQEVYWYTTSVTDGNNQYQTVKFSSQMARPNTSDIQNHRSWGGMYIKTFTNSRSQSGSVSNYYPSSNVGPDVAKFTFNSCPSTTTTGSAYSNLYTSGYCNENFLWVPGTSDGSVPANGNLSGSSNGGRVDPGTTFFYQLRYGTNNYGDGITDGTNLAKLTGGAYSTYSIFNYQVARSPIVDGANNSSYSTNTSEWTSEALTASVTKTTMRGKTESFLVMDTMRSSEGNEDWGTTESPTNLVVCATTTTTTTTSCENVDVSGLEFVSAPKSDSYTDQAGFTGLAWDASANHGTQAKEEVRYYTENLHTNTVTLTKGALKGTRVTLTFLPLFFRDGHDGFGGYHTKTANVKSIHPLLVTVENVTCDLDMHLNWTKNAQKVLSLGDAQGLEDLQIARNRYYEDGASHYDTSKFKWTDYSSTSNSFQWYDWTNVLVGTATNQSTDTYSLVIRFKVAMGYRIDKLVYGRSDGGGTPTTVALTAKSWDTFNSNFDTAFNTGTYEGQKYYTGWKSGATQTRLNADNDCRIGTDGYYYCRINPGITAGNQSYTFSFQSVSTLNYTVSYAASDDDSLTVGTNVGQVSDTSIETSEKSYNTAEFSGADGLQVTASRPTIIAAAGDSPAKFFLYWKVYIKYRVYTKDAETYEGKLADGTTYYYKLKAVQANTGDSVDDREGGNSKDLVVYPGQRVTVRNYFTQMPATTMGVVLKAKWTTALEYEAVTRKVTAYVQTYDSTSSLSYGWSAVTLADGASTVISSAASSATTSTVARQETYKVLIPQSNASSASSYASTYPKYDTTDSSGKVTQKGFLPRSATMNYVSNGKGGWTQQANTTYTLVSDADTACSADSAGTKGSEYCERNHIGQKMGAKAAAPNKSVPDTTNRSAVGDGQMMVGYYRVALQEGQKISYSGNVCEADASTSATCGYTYDTNSKDDFTASVASAWLFTGHYLFDNTRVPTAGSANLELPWVRKKAGSTQENAYQWLFKYWSTDATKNSKTGQQTPSSANTSDMTGTIIVPQGVTGNNLLAVGSTYYAQWEENATPVFSFRTEKSDGSDLDNGAVFQLFVWDFATQYQKTGVTTGPTSDDVIERNADGTGKAGDTKNGFWLPVIQAQSDYVLIPTVAQVKAGTNAEATQVETTTVMGHTGVAQWRGLGNGFMSDGNGNLTDDYWCKSSDTLMQQACTDGKNGSITLPTGTNLIGKVYALVQVKAPSSKYVSNTGQWMFKISDYVSGWDSTIASEVFSGTKGGECLVASKKNTIYDWGCVGGTAVTTAGTVHAIKQSEPEASGKNAYKRVAAVVNIDAFDLPAAGWRVPLLLMFAGLALTLSSWAAYGLNNRRRAMAYATARGSGSSGGRRGGCGGSGRRRRGRAAVRRVHAHIKARLRHGRRA